MTADNYTQRGVSQIAGWSVLVASFVVGISIYCVVRCCYKKTYYHAKYSNFYRDFEMEVFDKSMKYQIKSEVSAKTFPEHKTTKSGQNVEGREFPTPNSITIKQWNNIAFFLGNDDDNEKNMKGELKKQLTDDSSQPSTSGVIADTFVNTFV